jgi:hypothetical protein
MPGDRSLTGSEVSSQTTCEAAQGSTPRDIEGPGRLFRREGVALGSRVGAPLLVTPTYGPDSEQVRLLCRSLFEVGCTWDHLLVVQDEDLGQFTGLRQIPGTTVIPTSAVLAPDMERWRRRSPRTRTPSDVLAFVVHRRLKAWWSQQLGKLLLGTALAVDEWVCVDSDCVFLRPPRAADFRADDGGPALFDFLDFPLGAPVRRFHADAATFLGLPLSIDTQPTPRHTFVQQLIPLSREVAESLVTWVEEHHGSPWWAAMVRGRATEYSTYGLFASHLMPESPLTPVDRPACSTVLLIRP